MSAPGSLEARIDGPAPRVERPAAAGGRCVAVVGGKGGVGKTNLAANLAIAAAGLGQRVLLVDGDLGLSNVDVLLGLVPDLCVADVLAGRCSVEDALMDGPRGVRILPAASGRFDLASLAPRHLQALLKRIECVTDDFDLVLVDAGAGIGPSVVGLSSLCDPILLVTTGEPTAVADAYATLKVLHQSHPSRRLEVVVNSAADELDARETHRHLARVADRFLDCQLFYRGFLPSDPRLVDAVARQRAVVEAYPSARSSRRLIELAAGLVRDGDRPRARSEP